MATMRVHRGGNYLYTMDVFDPSEALNFYRALWEQYAGGEEDATADDINLALWHQAEFERYVNSKGYKFVGETIIPMSPEEAVAFEIREHDELEEKLAFVKAFDKWNQQR
jgi:ribonucleotide reductase beta subunit family protein with ferritin-like domain